MSCDQAWTCQELVDHADNWSLAGNVGLLKHMEQFAENLFKQADETNNNLENLLQDLSSTEIQLDLVKNQFLGLQNTQFIESRVYEDDETVTQPIVTPTEVKLDENKKKELLKTAVIDGLKVIDKYYDKISIPESDSEGDETDCSNYVLREKDPYIHRPLPYVIGTDEWHTKWHAGLVESSEDSDNDDEIKQNGRGRVEDEFSDTDSESNLPVADRRRMETQDYTYDEVNGNDNSVSAKTPITNATFAEQLAAKLGDVLTTPTAPSTVDILNDPEVNTRPIQRKPVVNSNLLPDLPPDITTGLFSGGGGLFDDDDDDYQEKPPPIGGNSAKETKKVPNLFDDDDNDDDDDAFSIKPPPIQGSTTNKVDKSPQKRVGSLFDDTDEDDEVLVKSEVETRRKPIGGVSVLPRRQVYSSDDEDESEKSEKIIEKPTKEEKPIEENIIQPPPLIQSDNKPEKRVLSLFDDTDDLFEDDLFLPSNISKKPEKPKSQAVKIDEGDVSVPPPLFKPVSTTSTTISQPQEAKTVESSTKKKKTRNLFDESSSEDEDDMFSSVIVPKTTPKPKNIDLFADTDVIFTENITKTTENVEKHEKSDEFLPSNEVSVDIPDVKPVVKPRFSLFDDKPPALLSDDDWDEEIPAVLVKKEVVDELKVKSVEESPKSGSSPEKKLPGKLKHNLNINVNALMPGAKVPKTQVIPQNIEDNQKVDEIIPEKPLPVIISHEIKTDSGDVDVLPSVLKTRVKIPVKRRPSTRQGRKAALATSQNSQDEEKTEEVAETRAEIKTNANLENSQLDGGAATNQTVLPSVESEILPSIDKETNLPPILQEETLDDDDTDIFDDVLVTKTNTKTKSLFDDAVDFDNEDIFTKSTSSSSTPRKQLIIEDNNDDNDNNDEQIKPPPLFEEEVSIPQENQTKFDVVTAHASQTSTTITKPIKKISLFDDDDDFQDSDDLFSSTTSKISTTQPHDLFAKKNVDNVRVFDTLPTDIQTQPISKAVVTPTTSKVVSKSLFGDDDDDSDLFGSSSIVKHKSVKKQSTEKKNISLFGDDDNDDDDDDDIFKVKTISAKVNASKQVKTMPKSKMATSVTKSDPLADLFGDSD